MRNKLLYSLAILILILASINNSSADNIFGWGLNTNGQVGDASNTSRNYPVQIGNVTTWTNVSCGKSHSIAIKSDGTLWGWGYNNKGQLGDMSTTSQNSPHNHNMGSQVWAMASAGTEHTLALETNGALWAVGGNTYGQLGIGNNNQQTMFAQIGSGKDWSTISAGGYHNLAIKSDGSLWAWGYNTSGQLGDASNNDRNAPVQVGTAKDWTKISAGASHSLAVKTDGTLWAWGKNDKSQVGDESTTDRNTPVQVGSAKDWAYVSAGESHSLAIKADGTLWAWGYNNKGQLGDASTTDRNAPKQIGTANDWSAVYAGTSHSFGVKTDGTIWAWGYNGDGQVGDGTNTDRTSPVQVTDINATLFASGGSHAVAFGSPNFSIATNDVSSSMCTGSSISVPFTITGTFRSDNTFKAQLSDNKGKFDAPTIIGTLTGTTSSSIDATIPSNASVGTAYRIRVISTNPATNGADNGANTSITKKPSASISGDTSACQKNLQTFTTASVSGMSYKWSVTNGTIQGADDNTSFTVQWNTEAIGQVKLTVTSTATGCQDVITQNVTLISAPTPNITGNADACQYSYETYSVASVSAHSYKWTITGGKFIGDSTSNVVNVIWTQEGTGKLKIIEKVSITGCTDSAQRVITVKPNQMPSITGENTVCMEKTYTYTTPDAPLTTTQWTVLNGTIVGASDDWTVDVKWKTTGSGYLTLFLTSSTNLCKDSIGIPVTINYMPKAAISGTDVVCSENTVEYTTTPDSNAVNQWYVQGGTIKGASNLDKVQVQWDNSQTASVILIRTTKTSPCKDSLAKSITVNQTPAPKITGVNIVGTGRTEIYTSNTDDKVQYLWAATNGTIQGENNLPTVKVAWGTAGTGSLKLTQTNKTSQCTASSTMPIEIKDKVAPAITGELSVCENQEKTYSTSSDPQLKNKWYVTGGTIKGLDSDPTLVITWGMAGNGTIKLIQTNTTNNSVDSAKQDIPINPIPVKPAVSRDGNSLTSSSNTGNQWYFNGSLLQDSIAKIIYPTQTGNYSVQVTLNSCSSVKSDDYSFELSGVNDEPYSFIKIYPNPAEDKLFVDFNNFNNQQISIRIYNSIGVEVYNRDSGKIFGKSTETINTNSLSSGIYLLSVQIGKAKYYQNLIINH